MLEFYNGGMHGERFGDGKFISEQIDMLPIKIQDRMREKYGVIYAELMETDEINARFRSNTWLRNVVKKYGVCR